MSRYRRLSAMEYVGTQAEPVRQRSRTTARADASSQERGSSQSTMPEVGAHRQLRVVAVAVEVVEREDRQSAGLGEVRLAAAGRAGEQDDARGHPAIVLTSPHHVVVFAAQYY